MSSNDDHVNRLRAMCGMAPIERTPYTALDNVSRGLGRDVTASICTDDLSKFLGQQVAGRAQVSTVNPFEKFAVAKAMTQPGMSGPSGGIANVGLVDSSYEYPGIRRPVPAKWVDYGDPNVHLGHNGPEPVMRK